MNGSYYISAPSSPPEDIHIEANSSTSIFINWSPPTYGARNGIIQHYSVCISAEQPWVEYSDMLISNETELHVQDLTPYITYQIRVNAHTILPGPFSNSYSITTLEAGIVFSCHIPTNKVCLAIQCLR